jgi:hypothetical protein
MMAETNTRLLLEPVLASISNDDIISTITTYTYCSYCIPCNTNY